MISPSLSIEIRNNHHGGMDRIERLSALIISGYKYHKKKNGSSGLLV